MLDELGTTELDCATLDELGTTAELDGATLEELGTTAELDSAALEEDGFADELEGAALEELETHGVVIHQYVSVAVLLMYCGAGFRSGFMV